MRIYGDHLSDQSEKGIWTCIAGFYDGRESYERKPYDVKAPRPYASPFYSWLTIRSKISSVRISLRKLSREDENPVAQAPQR